MKKCSRLLDVLIISSCLLGLSSCTSITEEPISGDEDTEGMVENSPDGDDTPSTQPVSDDPRTRLLENNPNRIGFGASATGGDSDYVYVKTFEELKQALQQDGNYVLLDPSLAGQQIVFTETVYPANNITIDGSLAPGHALVASPDLPEFHLMMNNTGVGGQGNKIFHSLNFVGNRSQHGLEHGALALFKGNGYWVDHVEISDFLDDAIGMGFSQPGSADFITISNSKIHNTGKALLAWYQDQINHGQGHITAFFNELAATERNPNNRGAEHFHFFNNWVHDWRFEAVVSGGLGVTRFPELAGNRTVDSVMLSQSNVYEKTSGNESQCAETADPADGLAYGGWMYIDGQSIYNGLQSCYSWGDTNRVDQDSQQGPGAPDIPYSYTLMPSSEVKAYIQQNAGPLK